MLFEKVNKNNILKEVKKSISQAKKEIMATMLLSEEIKKPLPISYFKLIKKKVNQGVTFKRLGFGAKEDYNDIKQKLVINGENYIFKYVTDEDKYQRLMMIDRKKLFFGINGLFFESRYKPLIKIFLDYFMKYFKGGR